MHLNQENRSQDILINILAIPKISVVIPVYNGERFLQRSLDALLAQTVKPTEIIIANDASTDDTVMIAQAYKRRYPKLIRVIHNPENKGINWTLNRCIYRETKNDYVFPTACDDFVLERFLEESLTALAMYPNAGLSFSMTHNIEEKDVHDFLLNLKPLEDGSTALFFNKEELVKEMIHRDLSILTNTMIINRKLAIETGGYIEELKWHSDLMLSYTMAFKYGAVYIPTLIAVRTFRDDSYGAPHIDVEKNIAIYEDFLYLFRTKYKDCYDAFLQSNFFSIWHYRIAEAIIKTPSMWHEENIKLCLNQLIQWANDAQRGLYGVSLEKILLSPEKYLCNPPKDLLFIKSCLDSLVTGIFELRQLVMDNIPTLISKGYSATALKLFCDCFLGAKKLKIETLLQVNLINELVNTAKELYQIALDELQTGNLDEAQKILDEVKVYFSDEKNILLFDAYLSLSKGMLNLYKQYKSRATQFSFNDIFTPPFEEILMGLKKNYGAINTHSQI